VVKAGWGPILLPRIKLRRALEPGDRLVLTVAVRKAILDVGFVEVVKVRRSRRREPK
jgi:hypothetical protein